MGDKTAIQWTDATWNPTTGCQRVSVGCGGPERQGGCYAEALAPRVFAGQTVTEPDGTERPRRFTDVRWHPERLEKPLRWRKPRRVFVDSMSDLFHEDVPDEFIVRVFAVMALARQHTFQILTKRPERMRAWCGGVPEPDVGWVPGAAAMIAVDEALDQLGTHWAMSLTPEQWHRASGGLSRWPLPNVQLGVSVEDQASADVRVPLLVATPAALRFLSCEPLLASIDLRPWLNPTCDCIHQPVYASYSGDPDHDGSPEYCELCGNTGVARSGLSWVIVGGESGPRARPMDLAWARLLVDQCQAAGIACFVKQLGQRPVYRVDSEMGRELAAIDLPLRDSHGADMDEWPEDLRVREFPTTGDAP